MQACGPAASDRQGRANSRPWRSSGNATFDLRITNLKGTFGTVRKLPSLMPKGLDHSRFAIQ
jgi:hypothetical protein